MPRFRFPHRLAGTARAALAGLTLPLLALPALAGPDSPAAGGTTDPAAAPVIKVVKQASCGCCAGWVARMEEAGYRVEISNVTYEGLLATKQLSGVPESVWGCHTAQVGGYIVEGHVPAREVARLLKERPTAIGIATPGMPVGSPGMEYGTQREAFEVVLIETDGRLSPYASYPARN